MVIAERKPLTDILDKLRPYRSILIAGCGGCMTVGLSGGAREVALMAQEIRLACQALGREIEVFEHMAERQCEPIFLEELIEDIEFVDAVVSLGCGVGVQALAEKFPKTVVLPALDTRFVGMPEKHGVWVERCQACGECIIDQTGGICPIARCSKNLLNGPCGGSQNGWCEVGEGIPCAWSLIYERMARLGEVEKLSSIQAAKNWGKADGPGKVVKGGRSREVGE